MRIQSQSNRPPVLRLQVGDRTWLILGNLSEDQQQSLLQRDRLSSVDYLVFFGPELDGEFLDQLRPSVLIIPSPLRAGQQQQISQLGIQILNLTEVGAVQWTPQQGLQGLLQTTPSRRDLS